MLLLADTGSTVNPFHKLVLSATEGYYLLHPCDIMYCKADDSYTHLHMYNGKCYTVSHPLKDFEAILTPHNFFRIHKSYLVNINHIEKINKVESPSVIMSNHEELPVAHRKKEDFLSVIRRWYQSMRLPVKPLR